MPPFPEGEWIGQPNFQSSQNTLNGTNVGPLFGGSWNEAFGSGVCYESSPTGINVNLLTSSDGYTVQRTGVEDYTITVNTNGTLNQATSGISTQTDVAVMAHGNPSWPDGSLTTRYVQGDQLDMWKPGDTKELNVPDSQIVMTIAYQNLKRMLFQSFQPSTASAPVDLQVNVWQVSDQGLLSATEPLNVPSPTTILGMAGNEDWFAVYVPGTVFLYEAGLDGYKPTHTKTLSVPSQLETEEKPYNLLGMSIEYLAVADDKTILIVPMDGTVGPLSEHPQTISLENDLDVLFVQGVQLENQLVLLHCDKQTILMTVAQSTSGGSYFDVTGRQALPLSGVEAVRLP